MKIERKDILDLKAYAAIREELRQQIIALKEERRFIVGPYLCFLFENRQTMLYQIQEMLRAESIASEEGIQHEIDTYNQLVPDRYEITATLLLEFTDETVRAVKLKELIGLEDSIHLLIDHDTMVKAEFDDRQIDSHKISSVQYIRFNLAQSGTDAFFNAKEIEIISAHPACSYRESLPPRIREALVADLKATLQA